jgi:hypothetical protein
VGYPEFMRTVLVLVSGACMLVASLAGWSAFPLIAFERSGRECLGCQQEAEDQTSDGAFGTGGCIIGLTVSIESLHRELAG